MAKSYEASGVNLEAGYEVVSRIKKHVKSTERPGSMGNIGAFGGMFDLGSLGYEHPILVSGTDGVGTKLKIAFSLEKHDTIGIDAVAMCVNDVLAQGARPLIFLDYVAVGKNHPEVVEAIVSGVAEGCRQAGCALVGGETAEMPGMYTPGEYDIAGFTVGAVEKSKLIDCSKVKPGDLLIGIASSGVHSNGFSLVRKIVSDRDLEFDQKYEDTGDQTLGEMLLTPTRIYVKALESIRSAGVKIKGCSHITGGGFYENIPRMLPEGVTAVIQKDSYPVPPIFKLLAKKGDIAEQMMYNTFNMGIGMVLAVSPSDADKVLEAIAAAGETGYRIGHVEAGQKGVTLC